MAEWHQLSDNEKRHANVFAEVLNNLEDWEQRELEAIKHDIERVKGWLHRHPKIARSGVIFTGLVGLYITKRYNMGSQLPPPPGRF